QHEIIIYIYPNMSILGWPMTDASGWRRIRPPASRVVDDPAAGEGPGRLELEGCPWQGEHAVLVLDPRVGEPDEANAGGIVAERIADRAGEDLDPLAVAGLVVPVPVPAEDRLDAVLPEQLDHRHAPRPRDRPVARGTALWAGRPRVVLVGL